MGSDPLSVRGMGASLGLMAFKGAIDEVIGVGTAFGVVASQRLVANVVLAMFGAGAGIRR
ncbi:hypothetical protein DL95DRAFT_385434 [Leptodontidium sp. 2 PMI_412]|nr:hypothetical protein DL95DRAFT_385434 [Leptodontidium sp. 2 PMI_412]